MIRLIVSDIDGTLVPEGTNRINPEYMEVIRELCRRGVFFAAASGRQAASVDAVFHELSGQIYYLSDNGAYIQENGKGVLEVRMDPQAVTAVIRELREIPDCHILLSVKEGYYTDDPDPDFHHLVFEQYRGSGEVVTDILEYADRCIKLSLYYEPGAAVLAGLLSSCWKERFSINVSGSCWLDINDRASAKGNAVRWIQEEQGITPEETMVFGDNFNDISMLERAERSYVSVLADPEVKRFGSREVASYKEDGVLQVLKQLLEEMRNED